MNKLWIFLRNTEDWDAMSLEKMQDGKMSSMNDPSINSTHGMTFISFIRQWNKCFSMNYFEYRSKIKELAMSTWGNIPFVVEDVEKLISTIEDDDYVLAIDDDDWLHPDFESITSSTKLDDISVFDAVCFDIEDSFTWEWNHYKMGLSSSNIVFKGSMLKQCSDSARLNFLKHHPKIQESAKTENIRISVCHDLPAMVCYVRHMGSHSRVVNGWGVSKVDEFLTGPKQIKSQKKHGWVQMYIYQFLSICDEIKTINKPHSLHII